MKLIGIGEDLVSARYYSGEPQTPIAVVAILTGGAAQILAAGKNVPAVWSLWIPAVYLGFTIFAAAFWLLHRKRRPSIDVMRARLTLFAGLLVVGGCLTAASGIGIFHFTKSVSERYFVVMQLAVFGLCLPPIALWLGVSAYIYSLTLCGAAVFCALSFAPLFGLPLAIMIVTFAIGCHVSMRTHAKRFESLVFAQAENASLARFDVLTGLPNRRVFFSTLEERFEKAKANGTRLAVGILDLDGFKPVNDSYGHHTGDRVLSEIAARLTGGLPVDATFYRLGGDEFAFHFEPSGDDVMLRDAGNAIIRIVEQPLRINERVVGVSGSMGIAVYPGLADSTQSLFEYADCALYHAKRTGRARAEVFSPVHKEELRVCSITEQRLRLADFGAEFFPEFQPIIDLRSGDVMALEVLARWQSPGLGKVSPSDFIPIAEQAGLVTNITLTMLRKCIEAMKEWRSPARVSLNLSAHDITNRVTVTRLIGLIVQSGLKPDSFLFEITETGLIRDFSAARESVELLRLAGARIALDDFGTGYSSLSHMQSLPLDTLKIDRTFVVDIETNPASRLIVRSIVSLCHGLGIVCVAEGAETGGQVDALKDLGCDAVQGFVFGKSMPADAVDRFLAEYHAARRPRARLYGAHA